MHRRTLYTRLGAKGSAVYSVPIISIVQTYLRRLYYLCLLFTNKSQNCRQTAIQGLDYSTRQIHRDNRPNLITKKLTLSQNVHPRISDETDLK